MLEDIIKEYGGVEVSPMDVYTDIFKLGEGYIQKENEESGEFKANPIAYWKNVDEKKGHYRILFEDTFEDTLKECQEADFAIINGISYFGRKNVQEHASKMYAMIFDYDGVTDAKLNNFLHAAYSKSYDIYPIPNYVVTSGHGLHLYYIFEDPVPLFPNIKLQLKNLKYALTERMWNEYTSVEKSKQFQGINQGFRVIGGKTKIEGFRSKAYLLNSHPCNLNQLCKFVPEENKIDETKLFKESKLTLTEARKLYPEWYQSKIVDKEKRRYWTCKRDLYDWWKMKIRTNATYHHRYFNIMCLAIYAAKSGIEWEELERDSYELIPFMNDVNSENPFTEEDVRSALECYDLRYCTFPIDDISKLSGIAIQKNKRNGRKQAVHLERARAVQDIDYPDGSWREGNGRKPKKDLVAEWRRFHPEGKKADCVRETGLTKPTVYKWWNGEPAAKPHKEPRVRVMTEKEKKEYDKMVANSEQMDLEDELRLMELAEKFGTSVENVRKLRELLRDEYKIEDEKKDT